MIEHPIKTRKECEEEHDSQPWVQFVMSTSSTAGWPGNWKLDPRKEYCQNHACYMGVSKKVIS